MRLVDRLYDWLSHGPAPDCDHIFAAALAHAEPGWSERIERILLRRGHESSWAALIGRYSQLPPEIREQLQESSDRMQAGIARAIRSSAPDARVNALLALEDRPCARLSYLLSEAIRDPAPKVRVIAARVLCKTVDEFLDRPPPADSADEETRQAYKVERRQFVLALEEALRTFGLHKRLEVLEACLWVARDLGERLWEKLTSRQSRAGVAASEHLQSWSHPRLAHFLTSSLKRSGWRLVASEVLRRWRTVPEVTALLRESDLLNDSTILRHLASVQSPLWFVEIDDQLTELAADLRPLAPRWVSRAGFSDEEKTALLSRWVQATDPRVHRAAVYALAEIEHDDVRTALKQVATSTSPLASFARWCVLADDANPVHSETKGDSEDFSPAGQSDDDFALLWQACRRTQPSVRHGLIATLRENADLWQAQLQFYLQSPDPRDRILGLQIISTEQLALHFRHALEPLLRDPVEGIRRLAEALKSALSQQPLPPRAAPTAPAHQAVAADERTQELARRELRTLLEQLATGAADPADADLIGKVREQLRQVYPKEPQASACAAPRGRKSAALQGGIVTLAVADAVFPGPVASSPLLESISNRLTSGPQSAETVGVLVGAIAFVLLIVLAARFFSRERSTAAEPKIDYLTLAVDVLGLSERDRRDLQQIARRAELAQPAAMLLSPANLARAAAPTLTADNDGDLRQWLDQLCLRLFNTPLPDPHERSDQPAERSGPLSDVRPPAVSDRR